MLFHLIKKDFMIVKKYVLIMLAVAFLIPLFVLWQAPQIPGSMAFVLSVIFSLFMLLQYVSMKEYQYPKAAVLLCATPYPRNKLVQSKYGFCLMIYIACCVIYWIETLLIPALGKLSLEFVLMVFFCISILIGTYLPVQFKLGYEKTKFAFMVVIMASPFLLPQLAKLDVGVATNTINSIPPMLLNLIIVLVSIFVLIVSAFVSAKIYDETDLA